MKNKHWPKLLTSLVAALFILSLFSGIAAAQSPKENYDRTKEQYQELKTKYDAAKQKYLDSKIKFIAAKDRFKSGRTNLSRDELTNKTRDYLIKSIDYVLTHLEVLKTKINPEKEFIPVDAIANIDTHITQLNDIRAKVGVATTPAELADAARQLDGIMIKMNLEARYYAGIIINHKIDQFIMKADNASTRMNTLIQKLEELGKDVTILKEYASTFDSIVGEAKTNHQNEVTLYTTHSGFDSNGLATSIDEARAFLQQAATSQKDTIAKLKSASEQFREFFKEAKKIIPGKVVRGTGKLEARGTGIARIKGDVTVTLTVSGNASLIVSSNADVTVDGTGTKETLNNGDVKYKGFGSATISGSAIRVEIYGDNITVTAEGTGSAVLVGKGSYHSEKGFTASGEWKEGTV